MGCFDSERCNRTRIPYSIYACLCVRFWYYEIISQFRMNTTEKKKTTHTYTRQKSSATFRRLRLHFRSLLWCVFEECSLYILCAFDIGISHKMECYQITTAIVRINSTSPEMDDICLECLNQYCILIRWYRNIFCTSVFKWLEQPKCAVRKLKIDQSDFTPLELAHAASHPFPFGVAVHKMTLAFVV